MNFILKPSLEHRAFTKIAITLWSQHDVRDCMSKSFHSLTCEWHEIEEVVIEKSSELLLPEILKKKLLNFIVPVGLEIISWIDFHQHHDRFVPKLPDTFFWTSLGTIDDKKTAEVLVKDETLSVHERFTLACTYCLKDEIHDLWCGYRSPRGDNIPVVSYWSRYMEEPMKMYASNITTDAVIAFSEAAHSGNEVATRYLLETLLREGCEEYVVEITGQIAWRIHYVDYLFRDFSDQRLGNVFLFLLSTMDPKQHVEIFTSYTYAVLKCLLVWPWQSLFMKTAKGKWDFLSKKEYDNLVKDFDVWIKDYKRNNILEIFVEFWQLIPDTYKEFIADQASFRSLLVELYSTEDDKSIQLLLKDSSISVRKKLKAIS